MTQPPPPPSYGQPQWGYPTPPPPWGRPTNTLAIVALVMTFVFFPAGFVLGLVALSQIKRTSEDGRGLAIAAVAVSSTFAVLLAALIAVFVHLGVSGAFDDNRLGGIHRLGSTEVGSCLRLSHDGGPSRVVDCETVHDQEVSYVLTIAGNDLPGGRTLRTLGDKTCDATFRGYVGVSSFDSGDDYDFYAPDQEEWDGGEHQLVCVIVPGAFGGRFHDGQQGSRH